MLDDIKNSTDLANLKERINNCSDEELAAAMEEEWLHGIIPDSGISDEDLARIKAEIHEQIGTRKQFTLKRVLKWTQIAAAIALPICMVIMGMMYKENKQYAAIPLTEITTQEGEQVSITLPLSSATSAVCSFFRLMTLNSVPNTLISIPCMWMMNGCRASLATL